jgi:hypothetical protein
MARSGAASGLGSSGSISTQPKPTSDDGGAPALGHHDGADEDQQQQQGERKRGLSITEAERIARKNMVKAGRERHDSLEGLAYSSGSGSGSATGDGNAAELLGDVGLGLVVDEVARMIGELAEHDDDIRRLKLE